MKNLIILGNFDGVHLGHQDIIKKALEYAKDKDLKVVVYTFRTLAKNKKLITTLKQRKEILLNLGVDEVIFEDFENIRKLSPKEFVENILIKRLNAKVVFCGYNYRFGYMKEGDTKTLESLIETKVVDEYRLDKEPLSSTKIRELLAKGDLVNANRLIGRNLEFEGIIVKGRQLGRLIGFKTANIDINENQIKIPDGVYGSITTIEGYDRKYLSITNVGTKPTISNSEKLNVETHILDFDEEIYGKYIKVELIKMIRYEKKFSTINDLKEQIQIDCNNWREENVRN